MKTSYSSVASRALRRSDKRKLIEQNINELADDPLSQSANVKRLQGQAGYRLRVQNWRVLFRMEGETVFIDRIAPRGAAYED